MVIKLIEVPGIGPKTAEYLEAQGLATVEDLVQVGIEALMKAPGFHLTRATSVLEAARALLDDTGGEATASGKKIRKIAIAETEKAKKNKKQKKKKKHKDKDKNKNKKKKDNKGKKNKKKKS